MRCRTNRNGVERGGGRACAPPFFVKAAQLARSSNGEDTGALIYVFLGSNSFLADIGAFICPKTHGNVRNKVCSVRNYSPTEVYAADKVSDVRSFNAKHRFGVDFVGYDSKKLKFTIDGKGSMCLLAASGQN